MKKVLIATIVSVVFVGGLNASERSSKVTECAIESKVMGNGITHTLSKCTERFISNQETMNANSMSKSATNSLQNSEKSKEMK